MMDNLNDVFVACNWRKAKKQWRESLHGRSMPASMDYQIQQSPIQA